MTSAGSSQNWSAITCEAGWTTYSRNPAFDAAEHAQKKNIDHQHRDQSHHTVLDRHRRIDRAVIEEVGGAEEHDFAGVASLDKERDARVADLRVCLSDLST